MTAFRVDKGGKGSFDRVMVGLEALRRQGVEWNALTTVHAANQHAGREDRRFLRDECEPGSCSSSSDRRAHHARAHRSRTRVGESVRDRPLYVQEGDLVTDRSIALTDTGGS